MWSTEQAIWFGQHIEDLNNDYLEDPVFGLNGMRRTREKVRMPLATNTVVVGFEQLAANVLETAVDVILLDTTFWGGIRPCVKAAGVCETFQLGVAVHSSGELGIQLATMLHLGAVIPQSLIRGRRALSPSGRRRDRRRQDAVRGGAIAVPTAPGLGVKLDRDRIGEYHELFLRLGSYPYDQDPLRPGWTPTVPNQSLGRPERRAHAGHSVLRTSGDGDARIPDDTPCPRSRVRALRGHRVGESGRRVGGAFRVDCRRWIRPLAAVSADASRRAAR